MKNFAFLGEIINGKKQCSRRLMFLFPPESVLFIIVSLLVIVFLEVIVSGFLFSKVCVGKNDKKGLNISLDGTTELDLAAVESSQGLKQGVFLLFSDSLVDELCR